MEDDSERSEAGDPGRPESNDEGQKPRIIVSPGDLHLATEEASLVLAASGQYYKTGNVLARIIEDPTTGTSTEQINEQTLKVVLSKQIDWFRRGKDDIAVRCDPSHGVVQALLYGQDRYHLPPLQGLARQPFYAPDGRLIDVPGYDPGTAIYASFKASDYRLSNPTRDLAEQSLSYFDLLLDEFEFETEADRSAAMSAMLTAAVRPSLPVAPAFNITATTSGSGKSYLSDIIAAFAGPEEPYRVTFPTRPDEASKLIITVLMARPGVVIFDDMDSDWRSLGPLNRALTSATTTERLLGSNRSATVSTNVLWMGTGNNVEPKMDLRRRVVSIRLAPKSATPALRAFQFDPVAAIRTNRARAVECALNVIGAFQAVGAPAQEVRPIGTYDMWSTFCRFPLIWLGRRDPAQSLIDQVSNDTEREVLGDFLEAWFNAFGTMPVTVRKLLAKAEQHPALMEVLEELPIMDGRYVNRSKLGWYISKNRGRRANGFWIELGDSSERRAWKVVGI